MDKTQEVTDFLVVYERSKQGLTRRTLETARLHITRPRRHAVTMARAKGAGRVTATDALSSVLPWDVLHACPRLSQAVLGRS